MVEISQVGPEPAASAPVAQETSKEDTKEEIRQKELVASEEPVEVVNPPVEPEVVASSVEQKVEPSVEPVFEAAPIAQEVVEQESSSPEIVLPSTFDAPSSPALSPVEPTQDVLEQEPSPSFPTLETHDSLPPQEVIVPATVVAPSSPTSPSAELAQNSEPSPSLLPLGNPVEEVASTPEPTVIEDTPIAEEPISSLVSPPSVGPSSRNSFETAPVAPSPPPPSTPPREPIDEIVDVTLPRPPTPTLDLDDPETPTAPTHVAEEVEVASPEPEAREEPKTLDEVAELVVEKVEVASSSVVAGVIGQLEEVGVVAKEEKVEEKEVIEEREIAQVRPPSF